MISGDICASAGVPVSRHGADGFVIGVVAAATDRGAAAMLTSAPILKAANRNPFILNAVQHRPHRSLQRKLCRSATFSVSKF